MAEEKEEKLLFNRISLKRHEGKLDSQNKLTIKIMLLLVMFVLFLSEKKRKGKLLVKSWIFSGYTPAISCFENFILLVNALANYRGVKRDFVY